MTQECLEIIILKTCTLDVSHVDIIPLNIQNIFLGMKLGNVVKPAGKSYE